MNVNLVKSMTSSSSFNYLVRKSHLCGCGLCVAVWESGLRENGYDYDFALSEALYRESETTDERQSQPHGVVVVCNERQLMVK